MAATLATGTVIVSIDLELDLWARPDWLRQRGLAELTPRLVELCCEYNTRATWAVADPAMSAASDVIRSTTVEHEIALLGDSTWIGLGISPERFERELSRRILSARSADIPLSTLALRGTALSAWQHLSKHGITALRPEIAQGGLSAAGSRSPGVREFPVQGKLPSDRRWWSRRQARRRLHASLEQAARHGGLFHLGIDASGLIDAGDRGLSEVREVLAHLRQLDLRRQISIETIAAAAARLSQPLELPPASSILNAA
ncbi:MAG TPA: hypothetical protein VFE24_13340 [Pirellulales bacterium]|jgi:hypothetical protein|nr:hypothetical protein [Pirellulales bacterium]